MGREVWGPPEPCHCTPATPREALRTHLLGPPGGRNLDLGKTGWCEVTCSGVQGRSRAGQGGHLFTLSRAAGQLRANTSGKPLQEGKLAGLRKPGLQKTVIQSGNPAHVSARGFLKP